MFTLHTHPSPANRIHLLWSYSSILLQPRTGHLCSECKKRLWPQFGLFWWTPSLPLHMDGNIGQWHTMKNYWMMCTEQNVEYIACLLTELIIWQFSTLLTNPEDFLMSISWLLAVNRFHKWLVTGSTITWHVLEGKLFVTVGLQSRPSLLLNIFLYIS